MNLEKIAFGGGCHWCTEAVFLSLKGVTMVEQGFVASIGANHTFSEAVLVHFDKKAIELAKLIEIHLLTHKSTSNHSMRLKYRSAIYTFSSEQAKTAQEIVNGLQSAFEHRLITKILHFRKFNPSEEQYANYYYNNPQKPFCENYIAPKLQLLTERYPKYVKPFKP